MGGAATAWTTIYTGPATHSTDEPVIPCLKYQYRVMVTDTGSTPVAVSPWSATYSVAAAPIPPSCTSPTVKTPQVPWLNPASSVLYACELSPPVVGSPKSGLIVSNGIEQGGADIDTDWAACYEGWSVYGTWHALPPAPSRRSQAVGVTAIIDGHQAYLVLGGKGPDCTGFMLTCADVERYDVFSGAYPWSMSAVPAMPVSVAAPGAVTVEVPQPDGSVVEQVLVFGGRQCWPPLTCGAMNTLQILDTATKSWSMGPSMPVGRSDVQSVAVVQDPICPRVYVMGGFDGATDLATVDVYDPCGNVWWPSGTVADMPMPVHGAVAGGSMALYYGSGVCVIGGYLGSSPTYMYQIYDVASNSWGMYSDTTARPNLAPTDPFLNLLVNKGNDPEVDSAPYYC